MNINIKSPFDDNDWMSELNPEDRDLIVGHQAKHFNPNDKSAPDEAWAGSVANMFASQFGSETDWAGYEGIGGGRGSTSEKLLRQGISSWDDLMVKWREHGGDAESFGNTYGVQGWRVEKYLVEPHQQRLSNLLNPPISPAAPAENAYFPSADLLRSLPENYPFPQNEREAELLDWTRRMGGQFDAPNKNRGIEWVNPGSAQVPYVNELGETENVSVAKLVARQVQAYNRQQSSLFASDKYSDEKRASLARPRRMTMSDALDPEGRPVLRLSYFDHDNTVESYDIHAARTRGQQNAQAQIFINNRENSSGGFALTDAINLSDKSLDPFGNFVTQKDRYGRETVVGANLRRAGNILESVVSAPRNFSAMTNITQTTMDEREAWFNYSQLGTTMLAGIQGSIVRDKEKVWKDASGKRRDKDLTPEEVDILQQTTRSLTGNQTYGRRGDESRFTDYGSLSNVAVVHTQKSIMYDASGRPMIIEDPNGQQNYMWTEDVKRMQLTWGKRGQRDLQVAPGVNAPQGQWNAQIEGIEDVRMTGGLVTKRYSYDQINAEGAARVRQGQFYSAFSMSGFIPGTTVEELAEKYNLAEGNVYTHGSFRHDDIGSRNPNDRYLEEFEGVHEIPGLPIKTGNRQATRISNLFNVKGGVGVGYVVHDITEWSDTEDKDPAKYMRVGVQGNDPRMAIRDAQGNITGYVDQEGAIPGDKDLTRVAVHSFLSQSPQTIRQQAISALTTVSDSYTDPVTGNVAPGTMFVNPATGKAYSRQEAAKMLQVVDRQTNQVVGSSAQFRGNLDDEDMAGRYEMRLNPLVVEEAAMRHWYAGIQEQNVENSVIDDAKYQEYMEIERGQRSRFVSHLTGNLGWSEEKAEAFASGAGRSRWQFFTSAEKVDWNDREGNSIAVAGDAKYNWRVSYNQRYRDVTAPDIGTHEVRTRGASTLTPEILDNAAETQPSFFQNLIRRSETGEFDTPSFRAFMTYRANVRDEEGELTPIAARIRGNMNMLNLGGEDAGEFFSALRSTRASVAQEKGNLTPDQQEKEVFSTLGRDDRFRGRNIQLGETVLPSVDTIANFMATTREGGAIKNLGFAAASAIDVESRYNEQVASLGITPESEMAFSTARAAAARGLLEQLGELVSHEQVRESAMELEVPAFSGAAKAAPLPANMAAAQTRDYARLVGKLSDEVALETLRREDIYGPDYQLPEGVSAKSALIRGFHRGDFLQPGVLKMEPGSNQAEYLQGIQIMSMSAAQKRIGGLQPGRGNVLLSEINIREASKDTDADTNAVIPDFGPKAGLNINSEAQLTHLTNISPAGETAGSLKKARRALDMVGDTKAPHNLLNPATRFGKTTSPEIDPITGLTTHPLTASGEKSAESKSYMAKEYNPFIRDLSMFSRIMMSMAGLEGDERDSLYFSQAHVGQSIYQLAVDLEQSEDPSVKFARAIYNAGGFYTDPGDVTAISPSLSGGEWSKGHGKRHYTTWAEAFNLESNPSTPGEYAQAFTNQMIRFGMRHRGIGNSEDIEEGKEFYARDVAEVAKSLAPGLGQNKERNAAVEKFLLDYSQNRYGEHISDDEFKEVFGMSMSEYTWGVRVEDGKQVALKPGEMALLPSYFMAAQTSRSAQAIEKYIEKETGSWAGVKEGRVNATGSIEPLALVPQSIRALGKRFGESVGKTAGLRNQYDQPEAALQRAANIAQQALGGAAGTGAMVERLGGASGDDTRTPEQQMEVAATAHETRLRGVAPALSGDPSQMAPIPQIEPQATSSSGFVPTSAPREPEDFSAFMSSHSIDDAPPITNQAEADWQSAGVRVSGSGGGNSEPPVGPPATTPSASYPGNQGRGAIVQFAPGLPASIPDIDRAVASYERLRMLREEVATNGVSADINPKYFNDFNLLKRISHTMNRRQDMMAVQERDDYVGPQLIHRTEEDDYFMSQFGGQRSFAALQNDLQGMGVLEAFTKAYDQDHFLGASGKPLEENERIAMMQAMKFLGGVTPGALGTVAQGVTSYIYTEDGQNIVAREPATQAKQLLAARKMVQNYSERLSRVKEAGLNTADDDSLLTQSMMLTGVMDDDSWDKLQGFDVAERTLKTVGIEGKERPEKVHPFRPQLAFERSANAIFGEGDRIASRTGIQTAAGESVKSLTELVESLKGLGSVSKDNATSVQHLAKAMDELDTRYAQSATAVNAGRAISPEQAREMARVDTMTYGDKTGREALNQMQRDTTQFLDRIGFGDVDVTQDQQRRDGMWSVLTRRGDRGRRQRQEWSEEGEFDNFLGERVNSVLARVFGGNAGQVNQVNQQAAFMAGDVAAGLGSMLTPHGMWAAKMAYGTFVGPQVERAGAYEARQVQDAAYLGGLGRMDLSGVLSGDAGRAMRRAAAKEQTEFSLQDTAHTAFGGLLGLETTPVGQGVMQAGVLAMPAVGAGVLAKLATGGSWGAGALAGGAMLAGSLLSSAWNAAGDPAKVWGAKGTLNTILGNAGVTAHYLWDGLDGTSDGDKERYARSAAGGSFMQAALRISQGESLDVANQEISYDTKPWWAGGGTQQGNLLDLYNRGEFVQQAYGLWTKTASSFGMTKEMANSALASWAKFNPLSETNKRILPTIGETAAISNAQIQNIDVGALTEAQMRAYGVSNVNFDRMSQMYSENVWGYGGKDYATADYLREMSGLSFVEDINAQRRMQGLDNLDSTWRSQFNANLSAETAGRQFELYKLARTAAFPSQQSTVTDQYIESMMGSGQWQSAVNATNFMDVTGYAASTSARFGAPSTGGMNAELSRFQTFQARLMQDEGLKGLGENFERYLYGFTSGLDRKQAGALSANNDLASGAAQTYARSIDLEQLARQRYSARYGGIQPTEEQLVRERGLIAEEMSGEGFDVAGLETESATSAAAEQINTARRRWGGETRPTDRAWLATLRDSVSASAQLGWANTRGQIAFERTGSEFLLGGQAAQLAETYQYNNPAESMRLQGNIQAASGYFNAALARGFAPGQFEQNALNQYATLSSGDRLVADAIAGGDRWALSNRWTDFIGKTDPGGQRLNARDAIRFQTLDTTTGQSAFMSGINRLEEGWIRDDAAAMGRSSWVISSGSVDYDAFQGGIRGMETRVHDLQWEQKYRERANQIWQRDVSMISQVGGPVGLTANAVGLDAQGFATGGDGLKALGNLLSPLLSNMGMTFNAGNGMGAWQLQDWQTNLGREQQMFSYQQQGQSLGLQWQQFEMQGQRFYEQHGRQMARAEWSEGYERRQMGIGREQRLTQLDWSEEDLEYNRNRSEMSFGWQMEDFEYNIRYARGRERRQLMKQRDRAVVSQAMQEGRFDTEEGRLDKRREWENETFKMQEEHFKKTVEWRREDMELSRRYFEQDRRLDEQRLQMQQQAHNRQLSWMQQQWQIEDQRRLIDRQVALAQYQQQVDMQNKAWETDLRIKGLNDSMTSANTSLQTATDKISAMSLALNTLSTYLTGVTQKIENRGGSPTPPTPGGGGGGGKGGWAEGGYTGDGAPWEIAGAVHRGEYVVPQNGSLVVRGENQETVNLLSEIRDLLRAIRERGMSQLVINGSDSMSKRVADLLDRTYQM